MIKGLQRAGNLTWHKLHDKISVIADAAYGMWEVNTLSAE